ncbi:hypothetical protein, partial [Anaerosolibacter sp.]|uniref:hypothetical protein n=1 Tax=Anaerosolibacter sp. TaxID=1872527 RepID=UPI0039EE12BB
MFNEKMYKEHYPTILHMITSLGIDNTDDYLRQELSNATKEVTIVREKILDMKNSFLKKNNANEAFDLDQNLDDTYNLLDSLIEKLK